MESINILMSVNKKSFELSQEMIFSILYYCKRRVNIYLMYVETELSLEDLEEIKKFVNKNGNGTVIPVKFDVNELTDAPVTDNEGSFFGLEAYSRLFCAFKLPKDLDRVLYLDADMICTGDISKLYDIDFDNNTWCACEDIAIRQSDIERLDLPLDYTYINSGVLLINLEKLRKDYTEKDIVKLIYDNKAVLVYPDQDFINKIFKGDIKIIDKKYNIIAKDIRYKDLTEKPLIIHYAGSVKPWHDDVSRFEVEYLEPYYESMRLQGNAKKKKLERLLEKHRENGYNN